MVWAAIHPAGLAACLMAENSLSVRQDSGAAVSCSMESQGPSSLSPCARHMELTLLDESPWVCRLRRQYADKSTILEQTLSERVLLAKQLEGLIRMADQVTSGFSGLEAQAEADADLEEED